LARSTAQADFSARHSVSPLESFSDLAAPTRHVRYLLSPEMRHLLHDLIRVGHEAKELMTIEDNEKEHR
jgi:hypothetical protein